MTRPNVIYPKFQKQVKPIPDQVVYLPSQLPKDSELVFSKEQCEWIVNYAIKNNVEGTPAYIGGGERSGGLLNKEVRDANVHPFPLNELTEPLYRKIMMIVEYANQQYGFDIDGIPHEFQLLRYEPGGHYNWHMDMGGANGDRKISVVVFLTDPSEYEGGELEVISAGKLPREQGTVATFPSYMMHTVNPVTKGTRWTLVSWITGTPFR